MPNLYIIAGPNGAGKTTASFTVLPEQLNCRHFVNADEIARGLSPFDVEAVAMQAARIMLARVQELLEASEDFSIETTLATKSYRNLVRDAQARGYAVKLLFFWLKAPELSVQRVALRVTEGGHDIPTDVIFRRYARGVHHLLHTFIPVVDEWMVFDNSLGTREEIARGFLGQASEIYQAEKWSTIHEIANQKQ